MYIRTYSSFFFVKLPIKFSSLRSWLVCMYGCWLLNYILLAALVVNIILYIYVCMYSSVRLSCSSSVRTHTCWLLKYILLASLALNISYMYIRTYSSLRSSMKSYCYTVRLFVCSFVRSLVRCLNDFIIWRSHRKQSYRAQVPLRFKRRGGWSRRPKAEVHHLQTSSASEHLERGPWLAATTGLRLYHLVPGGVADPRRVEHIEIIENKEI